MNEPRIEEEPRIKEKPRRSRVSKLLEFLFWIALAVLTAWILIQNVDSILPANSF